MPSSEAELHRALTHFEKKVRDSPLDAQAHHNLAAAYQKLKKNEECIKVSPCPSPPCIHSNSLRRITRRSHWLLDGRSLMLT